MKVNICEGHQGEKWACNCPACEVIVQRKELSDLRVRILDWAARMDCCASQNWQVVQEMGKEAAK